MYVSYDFYRDTFGGNIPAEAFPHAEMQAETHIRAFTYIKSTHQIIKSAHQNELKSSFHFANRNVFTSFF